MLRAELKGPVQVVEWSGGGPRTVALSKKLSSSQQVPAGVRRRGRSACRITATYDAPRVSAANPARSRCLRCRQVYTVEENGPMSCSYHGHMTGDAGMFALAPPHQGIDGEWTDESGVIVYKWKGEGDRPNTGRSNWKQRWTCCGVYGLDAPPCRKGPHVSYDDGFTMF